MPSFKIIVNPLRREVTYSVEGQYEELVALDVSSLDKMNGMVKQIHSSLEDSSTKIINENVSTDSQETLESSQIEINIPSNLVDTIIALDERIRFPILWYYSNKPRMIIKDFLMACANKGFSLSPSWLPSAGGNFRNRLVTEDKMFKESGKIGKDKAWEFTDVGKIKILKVLESLKGQKSEKQETVHR